MESRFFRPGVLLFFGSKQKESNNFFRPSVAFFGSNQKVATLLSIVLIEERLSYLTITELLGKTVQPSLRNKEEKGSSTVSAYSFA